MKKLITLFFLIQLVVINSCTKVDLSVMFPEAINGEQVDSDNSPSGEDEPLKPTWIEGYNSIFEYLGINEMELEINPPVDLVVTVATEMGKAHLEAFVDQDNNLTIKFKPPGTNTADLFITQESNSSIVYIIEQDATCLDSAPCFRFVDLNNLEEGNYVLNMMTLGNIYAVRIRVNHTPNGPGLDLLGD